MKTVKRMLFGLGVLVVAAVAVLFSLFKSYSMPSGSMQPTIAVGQHFFVYRLARTPRRGDVIVFRVPNDPDKEVVNRAVAVAGETVEIRAGEVFIDGKAIERKAVTGPCHYEDVAEDGESVEQRRCRMFEERLGEVRYRVIYDEPPAVAFGEGRPIKVPAGHVYVVGDNRDNSHDSRAFGPVAIETITGTAQL